MKNVVNMTITLNGKPKELTDIANITALLVSLGLKGKPVVVEHNKSAIFPRDYDTTIVQDADRIEIINIAAGG